MSTERPDDLEPRVVSALAELQGTIQKQYPSATFEVGQGEDPPGTYLWAMVDVEDTDPVMDLVIDRLLELQIEERLPIHVIPVHSPQRVLATVRRPAGRIRVPTTGGSALLNP